MSASKLVKPSTEYKESYLEAFKEFQEEDRYSYIKYENIENDFDSFIDAVNTDKKHLHKPFADWVEPVPETALWFVKDKEFIGTINIRHRLNWHLEKWGGHVNFIIRPSMRHKGFGKKILRKALPYLAHLGINRALLTVDPKDEESIKIIEQVGAIFEDETVATDKFPPRRRYWLLTE